MLALALCTENRAFHTTISIRPAGTVDDTITFLTWIIEKEAHGEIIFLKNIVYFQLYNTFIISIVKRNHSQNN